MVERPAYLYKNFKCKDSGENIVKITNNLSDEKIN